VGVGVMALKVSITLPGQTVITVEASEPEVFKEVVSIALRELPRDLIRLQASETSSNGAARPDENLVPEPVSKDTSEAPAIPREAQEGYTRFTASLSPVGDMRRVVVAAEGARRFLGMEGVSEAELGHLFDLAGWRRPGSFLQTLRNGARSKFRWLERVPGNPGYYAISQQGSDAVLGQQGR
jgi:hypothetical protein